MFKVPLWCSLLWTLIQNDCSSTPPTYVMIIIVRIVIATVGKYIVRDKTTKRPLLRLLIEIQFRYRGLFLSSPVPHFYCDLVVVWLSYQRKCVE